MFPAGGSEKMVLAHWRMNGVRCSVWRSRPTLDGKAEARRFGRQRRAEELGQKLYEAAEKAAYDPRFTAAIIFALKNLDPENWRY